MLAVIVCLGVSAAAVVIWTRAQRRRLDPKRDVLDFETIVQRFYPTGDVTVADVERAFTRIAEATGVGAGALRPGDRFDRELTKAARRLGVRRSDLHLLGSTRS